MCGEHDHDTDWQYFKHVVGLMWWSFWNYSAPIPKGFKEIDPEKTTPDGPIVYRPVTYHGPRPLEGLRSALRIPGYWYPRKRHVHNE